jgi:hypothetical protein
MSNGKDATMEGQQLRPCDRPSVGGDPLVSAPGNEQFRAHVEHFDDVCGITLAFRVISRPSPKTALPGRSFARFAVHAA